MPEFINPNAHSVYLVGPDGKTIGIGPGQRRVLSEYFDRYCNKGYLRRVDGTAGTPRPQHKRIATVPRSQADTRSARPRPLRRMVIKAEEMQQPRQAKIVRSGKRSATGRAIVGRQVSTDAGARLVDNLVRCSYPISNGIGVGVLSYNRAGSLRRLLESISLYSDLRRVTVFVSDDGSDDADTRTYLDSISGGSFVVLKNGERLGVAGNTNRLLRCLERFEHCLLLNDDVEVLATGWDSFYAQAATRTGLKHFCMRQPGVYGARPGESVTIDGVHLNVVESKPHGAVLAFTHDVLGAIGYFDERFGYYGMEHVDWSDRVACAGLQHPGHYDVVGSDAFFRIHSDPSAVADRVGLLQSGRLLYSKLSPQRGYVAPTMRSCVPALSVVMPCRDYERHDMIQVVVNGIRAQRFPAVEIIVVEHDDSQRLADAVRPAISALVASGGAAFNKSKAFNCGVALATAPIIAMHDADILAPADYLATLYGRLADYEACHIGRSVVYATLAGSETAKSVGIIDESTECDKVVGYFEGGSLACRRDVYWRVGGFNEDFCGYGVEDCEFYDRLSANSVWYGERTVDFLHLWHGRSPGWQHDHLCNREINSRLQQIPMAERLADQRKQLEQSGYGSFLS